MSANIFVIGLDEFNQAKLEKLANSYQFHTLLSIEDTEAHRQYPFEKLFDKAVAGLESFSGSIDAVVGYWDFPVTSLIPLLTRRFDLPGASVESVTKCVHKYWSRLEQQQVIPDQTPAFNLVDPFAADPLAEIELDFPFWLKPIKSFGSYLGFKIETAEDFETHIETIRDNISTVGEPFNQFLDHVRRPPDIDQVDGNACLAEQFISGAQCTVSGYAHAGQVEIYGIIDSIRAANEITFSHYQYPSVLPGPVQERLRRSATQIMTHLAYDNAPFNIEFFYNEAEDHYFLLEINPRISQSHGDLYDKVDGQPNHKIMAELALGRRPDFPHRAGDYAYAAKFFFRKFEDAVVRRTPTRAEIEAAEKEVPDMLLEIQVQTDMRLSELDKQASYSYDIAHIFLGGDSPDQLEEKYRCCLELLPFEFEPVEANPVHENR